MVASHAYERPASTRWPWCQKTAQKNQTNKQTNRRNILWLRFWTNFCGTALSIFIKAIPAGDSWSSCIVWVTVTYLHSHYSLTILLGKVPNVPLCINIRFFSLFVCVSYSPSEVFRGKKYLKTSNGTINDQCVDFWCDPPQSPGQVMQVIRSWPWPMLFLGQPQGLGQSLISAGVHFPTVCVRWKYIILTCRPVQNMMTLFVPLICFEYWIKFSLRHGTSLEGDGSEIFSKIGKIFLSF